MRKFLIFFAFAVMVLGVIVCTIVFEDVKISDMILALTALIVLWYTYETQKIRKFNDEQLKLLRKPLVSSFLKINQNCINDLHFTIINLSNYPVTCMVKLNAVVFGTAIESPITNYQGKKFWDIGVSQRINGHFQWSDLITQTNDYPQNKMRHLEKPGERSDLYKDLISKKNSKDRNIQLVLEVFSYNIHKLFMYYPPKRYTIEFFQNSEIRFIQDVTSDEPHLDYEKVPEWVDKSKLGVIFYKLRK